MFGIKGQLAAVFHLSQASWLRKNLESWLNDAEMVRVFKTSAGERRIDSTFPWVLRYLLCESGGSMVFGKLVRNTTRAGTGDE